MKRASFKLTATLFIISGMTFCFQCYADQQTSKDDGVAFAKSLTGGVVNGAKNTPASTVPGYTTTALPQTGYYGSQDLGGMQTDAQTLVSTGAGNEAAQFAYQQSTVPKLLFSDTDPLITNAKTTGTDAVMNPSVVSVTTGNCAVTNVSSAETKTEHCTAWMIPTTHTCNRTADVSVKWDDISNCPLATTFNETVEKAHNAPPSKINDKDFIRARAYCNPGSGNNVDLQVYAHGQQNSCSGWKSFSVSTYQPTPIWTGVESEPDWFKSCRTVPSFISGQCVGGTCNYVIDFYGLRSWNYSDSEWTCNGGIPISLTPYGYVNKKLQNPGWKSDDYCHFSKSTLSITFAKPELTKVPTVTKSWIDGCGYLDAQVQP